MKRKRVTFLSDCESNKRIKRYIDNEFIEECSTDFNTNSGNIIARNIVTNVGSLHATLDNDEARKVSHIFLNTIKKKNLKATNQHASGRCWIFSGLNMFRHAVIHALGLDNFEFSETYIFFWDKFERSNCYLEWINDIVYKGKEIKDEDNLFKYLIDSEKWMSDGGYWSCFANLVEKYGIIPKSAMPETFQSEYSEDMNIVLMDILQSTTSKLSKLSRYNSNRKQIINNTLKQIYNTLVKFLGEPPKTFNWDYITDADTAASIRKLTPVAFKQMLLPDIDLNDFVLLSNIPSKTFKYYTKYVVNNTNNVFEMNKCETINLPIYELKKYARKSLLSGLPVWFAGDIGKGFNPIYSSLNDKLNKKELLFGNTYKMNKEDRIFFSNQKTSHAMTLTGINLDEKNRTTTWQVENSWGFLDNETPGLDGFLCMDDKWFEEYLGQIVIHKKFLSRSIQKILDSEPIIIEPWQSVAPALKILPNY